MTQTPSPLHLDADTTWWRRGLARICGPDGILVGFAFDHRNSMAKDMRRHDMPDHSAAIGAFKREVVAALAPGATLVLLDPDYGIEAVRHGDLPGNVAFAMPLEARRAPGSPFHAPTELMPDWTAARARHVGADACKLLLPLRTDHTEHARRQLDICAHAIRSCHEAGVIPIIEPVAWPDDALEPDSAGWGEAIVDGAARVSSLGTSLLKVQYPGDDHLDELNDACHPNPWVLLGGGATADALRTQVDRATAAGASGFLVGRTLFRPALLANPDERALAITQECLTLLADLATIARTSGRPIHPDMPRVTSGAALASARRPHVQA